MTDLDQLEAQSIFILREAYHRLRPLALLWSLGKDSNVLVWLARKAFLGRVPVPVLHVDTGKKFPEMYAFRDRYAKEWNLNFIRELCPPKESTDPSLPPAARSAARNTLGLKDAVAKHGFNGLILGIRRDEEAIRLMSIDPHSPNEFRCNQIVRNIDEFYEAFGVSDSDALWLPADERVTIW